MTVSRTGKKPAVGLALFPSLTEEDLDRNTSILLHPEEIKTGCGFASDIRRRSFLQGRIAGKIAMNQVFPEIQSAGVRIISGSLGSPLFQNLAHPYGISIAHGTLWNAALCFPLSVPMGIDVESITEQNRSIIPSVLSDHEKEICNREGEGLESLHVLWTAREAAGKAIRLGYRVPHEWYEVADIETIHKGPYIIRRCRFKQLSVFTALSLKIPDGILSIAFPADEDLDQLVTDLMRMKAISSVR